MSSAAAYAAVRARAALEPYTVERREPGPRDVTIDILYCGVCHSDLHQARDEWGGAIFPMVPGHEIVGRVAQVGSEVRRFKVGELAAVGCMVDSCHDCGPCRSGREQFCERGMALTYNGTEMDRKTPTYGGYSSRIVVTEDFVLRLPAGLDPAAAAPLLCAGITTYSPLRRFQCKPGDRVGVLGLGGLGHMAVKLAAAIGAEVTMFSSSPSKEADARRLGAHAFALTRDGAVFKKLAGRFDLLIDTISAPHDLNQQLGLLRPEGTLVLVGAAPEPTPVSAFSLILANRRIAGSLIGGVAETQELLDFCGEHRIVSEIELIPIQRINEAYERMIKGEVRYRFVIDLASLER
jgi:uncharacterized zinc-type alcohol dehydrogenase-like protein